MACRLDGAKPLSEPLLEYCSLDPWEQTSVKISSEFKNFHSRKCIWKCRLRNGVHLSRPQWVNSLYPSDFICDAMVLPVYKAVGLGVGDDAILSHVPTAPLAAVAEEVSVDADLVAGAAVEVEDVTIALTDHVLRQTQLLTWKTQQTHLTNPTMHPTNITQCTIL